MSVVSKCGGMVWSLTLAAMLTLLLAPMSWGVNLRGAELSRAIRQMMEAEGRGHRR